MSQSVDTRRREQGKSKAAKLCTKTNRSDQIIISNQHKSRESKFKN